jgi:hypothetical protein
VHQVGFITGIYQDARPTKQKIRKLIYWQVWSNNMNKDRCDDNCALVLRTVRRSLKLEASTLSWYFMIRTTVDWVTVMCVFTHVSGGNLVEVVCSIDSTSSYCTAGQITDRYISLSQLIYTSGLKKQSKENEDATKLVCSVGKLVEHKHLAKLRSLALELHFILHSFIHYWTHLHSWEGIILLCSNNFTIIYGPEDSWSYV